jgi:hypothetical protein
MDNLSSGLRSGAAIGGMIKGGMDTSAVQNAAQRIQAGENQQAVISELMAQSPQAAQQLMNLLGGQQNLDAGATEIEALKTKVGMQSLQQAALPIFGALQVDDDGARGKLLNEAAMVFEKQSPETAAVIRQIGGLQGKQQFDAVAGIVKSLRSAGVFPDDPSQLQGSMPADVSKFEYWKQMNPNATEAEAREVYNKIIDPFYRSQASAQGAANVKLKTEESMNDVLANREAAKVGAIEKTETGAAKLAQEEQAVTKGEREAAEAAKSKENAVAAMNNQLQQIGVLRGHKGFESAVGKSSYIPSIRGGEAFNFERQLEKLNAQSFLAQIPNMVGMGALSNAEGEKINASMSALHVGMSEEEFQRELNAIEEVLKQGRERIKTGSLLKADQQTQQATPASSTVGRFKIEVQ